MGKCVAFVYGLVAYAVFLVSFLFAVGFVGGQVVPKHIDSGDGGPIATALLVNVALMSLFAAQHSIMARPRFKRWWTQFVPKPVERSTYVLCASLALLLLFWQWRPIPAVVWHIDQPWLAQAVTGVSFLGWLIVLSSTFLISHFELFGVRQVVTNLSGRTMPPPRFRTPLYYNAVRHPIYLGFIIAFWATPTMTAGHLLFAAATTAYIMVGILLEEQDLLVEFGEEYRRYRARVAMLVPRLGRGRRRDAQAVAVTDSRSASA